GCGMIIRFIWVSECESGSDKDEMGVVVVYENEMG
nr:hypothetical protein [Tanacetum cinerariifolium]